MFGGMTQRDLLVVIGGIILLYIIWGGNLEESYSIMGTEVSDVDQQRYTIKKAVCSRKTGECIQMRQTKEAANQLATVKKNLIRLVATLKSKYPDSPDVTRLVSRFSPDAILEGSNNSGLTTYTVNKGQEIAFCLRTRDNQRALETDMNTLMYVALHELSHILDENHDPNHKNGFPKKMQFIIKEAVEIGIYSPRDYRTTPAEHCGITINSNI